MNQFLVESVHFRLGDIDHVSKRLITAEDANRAVYECIRKMLDAGDDVGEYNPNRQYVSSYGEFFGNSYKWYSKFSVYAARDDGALFEVEFKADPEPPSIFVENEEYIWMRNEKPDDPPIGTIYGPPILCSFLVPEEREQAELALNNAGVRGLYAE